MTSSEPRLLLGVGLFAFIVGCSAPAPQAPAPAPAPAPAASVAADVVATFRGGAVRWPEVMAAESEPEVSGAPDAGAGDWRVVRVREVAIRKALAAEEGATDTGTSTGGDAAESILVAAMERELGWNDLTVTEQELQSEYDAHPEIYYTPEKLRLQHIYLRAEESDGPSVRASAAARLEGVRKELLAGADFAELAKRHSDSDDASAGGFLTIGADAKVFTGFKDVAWSLSPGELSGVVDTPNGFHLLELVRRIPAVARSLAESRTFVAERARAAKLLAAHERLLETEGARFGFVRHYELLSDPSMAEDAPLFVLDGVPFTTRDLTARLPGSWQSHLYRGMFSRVTEFLDDEAVRRLTLLLARKKGLDDRADVAEAVDKAREQIRYTAALERRIATLVARVPPEEIEKFFVQNHDRYQTVRRQTVSVILLKPGEKEPWWETLKRGDALAERIRAGEDFGTLAREHSQHYSARDGGRIGPLTNSELNVMVESRARGRDIIDALEVGEVSKAFVAEVYDPGLLRYLRAGVLVARLEARELPRQAELGEVLDLVRANYGRRFYTTFKERVEADVASETGLVIHEQNFPPL